MANVEYLKAKRKELKITFEELSSKSGIPLRTLENIFHGITINPRIDTMQAIERALGLAPTFTAEEQAQGAVNSPTVLSDRDLHTLGIINRAEDVLGVDYVDAYLTAIDIAVEQKLKK